VPASQRTRRADAVDRVDRPRVQGRSSAAAVAPKRLDKLVELDFPALPLDAHGHCAPLSLQVPANAIGLLVTIEGPENGYYLVDQFSGPRGKALVSDGSTARGTRRRTPQPFDSPNRSVAGMIPGTGALLVPNSSSASLCAGAWTLRVCGTDAQGNPVRGPVHVRVQIKVAPRLPRAGRLDLHLHFTGARGLTAAAARRSRDFKETLVEVRGIFAKVGIDLGTITYDDVSPRFQKQAIDGADSKIGKMFKTSTDSSGVNLYIVKELSLVDQGVMSAGPPGFSGGMPGPANAGTAASGVAMAMDCMRPACVMAHEIGHFLGLFHTHEQFINAADPIKDTPVEGWGNLMHPDEGSGGPNLTPGQVRVLLAHPLVQITR